MNPVISVGEEKRSGSVSGLDDASLGDPLLRAENKSDACDNIVGFFQHIWPCTFANDRILKYEMGLREAATKEGASPKTIAEWQNSRLSQITHPNTGVRLEPRVAEEKRHQELNVRRGFILGFLLLLTAGAAALGATLSTNNRSSSSPFVPPVPDNSSQFPSASPTFYPTEFTNGPTWAPTEGLTLVPTSQPSRGSSSPTVAPTPWLTSVPTRQPSRGSSSPTVAPTPWPTSSGQVVINYQQPDTSSWGCSQGGACLGYPGQVLSLSGGGSIQYTAIIQATGETQLYSCDLTNTDQVAALNAWFKNLQCQYYPAEAQVDFKMVLKDSGGNEVSNMDYSQTLFSTRRLRGGSPSVDNKNTEREEVKLTVRG